MYSTTMSEVTAISPEHAGVGLAMIVVPHYTFRSLMHPLVTERFLRIKSSRC
jgi:hypothetical protein